MATMINKDKQISKQRQEFVEHNFEAMVGARKRRYSDTSQQKQRTEFFEDYYLLYTRIKDQWQKLKEWLNDRMEHYNDCLNENVLISSERQEVLSARYNQCFETIAQMEYIEKELEGEDESL